MRKPLFVRNHKTHGAMTVLLENALREGYENVVTKIEGADRVEYTVPTRQHLIKMEEIDVF